MNARKQPHGSQIFDIPHLADPLRKAIDFRYLYNRIRRFLKRRLIYINNWFLEIIHKSNFNTLDIANLGAKDSELQPGDLVRVRSKDEIKETLSRWNSLKGCTFLEEMWPYCGTTQHVMKKVERFLDERDYQTKKTKGVVLLEGIICAGTIDFGKCDRSCFFFWREEWLEKIK